MNEEDEKYLDSLDEEMLLAIFAFTYGHYEPIWEECSEEEYYSHVPKSPENDVWTLKDLEDTARYLFSSETYKSMPVYKVGTGLFDVIRGAKPDCYKYYKKTGERFVFMLGKEQIDYLEKRGLLNKFTNNEE